MFPGLPTKTLLKVPASTPKLMFPDPDDAKLTVPALRNDVAEFVLLHKFAPFKFKFILDKLPDVELVFVPPIFTGAVFDALKFEHIFKAPAVRTPVKIFNVPVTILLKKLMVSLFSADVTVLFVN